ncbi:hypothetical protein DVH24_006372 [Malus domestica]|uniref:MYB domain class transcription factor n=1 Tax=Malus domestica TaxID=3750 RepID=A0A498KH80_MALDO|nr:hypothetical protein DVH24_006372 [Malus domestica]
MSRTTNESEDGVLSKDQIDSPLMDESNGGSGNGGMVLKKGPWTSAEDAILVEYVKKHGEGNWNAVQKHSGLFRCGKSCRLRWANHLRPNLKKGAFTPEEERLIVELHAKMGNKWARMAAHLPGRTDNEIKNYWNTRIKRRQRAGLPLYPPEVCLQAFQESQQGQSSGGINDVDRVQHDSMQANSFEIPDVVFDSLKGNGCVLPYVPDLPDISPGGMLMKGLGSAPYCGFMPPTMHRQKRLRESTALFSTSGGSFKKGFPQFDQFQNDTCDKVARTFGLPFPHDPDPTTRSPLSFGVIQGSHSLSNGNSSASKPTSGAVKLELPSLQYPETDLGSWSTSPPPPLLEAIDAFIQSPPQVGTFEPDCTSPRNSGLLDALLHEAKALSSAKNHPCEKSSNSSSVTPGDVAKGSNLNICEAEWEENRDPISPLGHSATSLFSECTPISASGSSLDEPPPAETFTGEYLNLFDLETNEDKSCPASCYDLCCLTVLPGCNVKSEPVDQAWAPDKEKEIVPLMDYTRPDAILASEWFGNGMHESIASLLGDDLAAECKHLASGNPTSNQGLGFSSCPWNTMPPVCQMSAQHP